MTLQDSAGRDGVGTRAAAAVVALLAVDAVWNLSLNTLLVRSGVAETMNVGFDATLPLTTLGAVGGLALATVAGITVLAALVRTIATDTSALGSGETPVETLVTYLRAVAVTVVGLVAAGAGLAVLVVPGLVVLVHLPLVFVAVANGDPIGRAVDRTWTRVRGSRARVVAVGLAIVAVPLAFTVVTTLTAMLPSLVELAVGVVVTGVAAATGVVAFTRIADSLDDSSTGSARTDRVNPTASGRL
jgi:hypothetical protein